MASKILGESKHNMKLLVINFEMDELSAVLSWQAEVVYNLAINCDRVVVLTEKMGQVSIPHNVSIVQLSSIIKKSANKIEKIVSLNTYVYNLIKTLDIDVCFIHMAHEWAYRLYPAFKAANIPVLLWYAHGSVTKKLKIAHKCVDRVVTSTPEGFRIPSSKVHVIGQGINTKEFPTLVYKSHMYNMIYVGRISKRKNIELLVDVVQEIKELAPELPIRLKLIGPSLTLDDLSYDHDVRIKVWKAGLQDRIDFIGYVPQKFLCRYYEDAFVHINVSRTGSMDKSVLESLAMGCPVLTSNEAFFDLLKNFPEMLLREENPTKIANQVLEVLNKQDQYKRDELQMLIQGHHDIGSFTSKLMLNLHELLGYD